MTYLTFISDEDLINAVRPVIETINNLSGGHVDITRNKLDPFGAFYECAAYDFDLNGWMQKERSRQAQKTIQNKIGDFHEALIGSLEGCQIVPKGKGLDILNIDKTWCAEIKNKHNTTKGNHKPRLYDDIKYWVEHYTNKYEEQYTGYYVQIIPSKPQDLDQPFTPSDGGIRRPTDNHIREISGALFYKKITGIDSALLDIYKILPKVLKDEFNIDTKISENELESLFKANVKS